MDITQQDFDHNRSEPVSKILRVVTLASRTGRYGGPFDTAMRQAAILTRGGASVTLLAGCLRNDRPRLTDLEFADVTARKVYPIFPRMGFSALLSGGMIFSIIREVRKADAVHISYAREAVPLLATFVALCLGKLTILQPHGMMTSRASAVNRVVDLIALPMLRRANTVVSLTSQESNDLISLAGIEKSNIVQLGNPLPANLLDSECVSNTIPNQALFLSRLHPRKRLADYVEAARIAEREGWPDKYHVVGPDEGDLRQLRDEVPANLHYEGSLPGALVAERVRACSVFVMVSFKEPWGNVLAIALALGKPVVVTSSAAVAENIQSCNAGIVVADHSPGEIARAIHEITSNPIVYSQKASGAIKYADTFLSYSAQNRALSRILNMSHGESDEA